jgi:chorismate mutase
MQDINDLRQEIDLVDQFLLKTLAKRMEVSAKIGEYKKQHGLPPLDEKRWQKVLSSILEAAQDIDLNQDFVKEIYEIIHRYSLQKQS